MDQPARLLSAYGLDQDLAQVATERGELLELEAEVMARDDGWYKDLVARASQPGHDPHSGWRD